MFALVQQTFLAKKNLVKSMLISTLGRQGNLGRQGSSFVGTFLKDST
jgi:hypothetical protein